MKTAFLRFIGVAAALVVACANSPSVQSSDVLELTWCPSGTECQPRADGVSRITIQACIPSNVTSIAANQTVTLQASSGAWQLPTDPTKPTIYTASLSATRCVAPVLLAPSNALDVTVMGTLDGYVKSVTVPLSAAALDHIELSATPDSLTAGTFAEIAVRAVVRAKGGGSPTSGTTVTFNAVPTPTGAFVDTWPQTLVIDQTGQALTTLVGGQDAASIKVMATASGPVAPGASAMAEGGASADDTITTGELEIAVLPAHGGASN